jgi:hypothetical protein
MAGHLLLHLTNFNCQGTSIGNGASTIVPQDQDNGHQGWTHDEFKLVEQLLNFHLQAKYTEKSLSLQCLDPAFLKLVQKLADCSDEAHSVYWSRA